MCIHTHTHTHTHRALSLCGLYHCSLCRKFNVTACNVMVAALPICFSWGPCIWEQCIAVNIRFLLTICNEGAGSGFLQLTAMYHTQHCHIWPRAFLWKLVAIVPACLCRSLCVYLAAAYKNLSKVYLSCYIPVYWGVCDYNFITSWYTRILNLNKVPQEGKLEVPVSHFGLMSR